MDRRDVGLMAPSIRALMSWVGASALYGSSALADAFGLASILKSFGESLRTRICPRNR